MDIPTTPQELGATAAMAWAWALEFLPKLGGSILILIVGLLLAKWASRAVVGFAPRGMRVDETVRPVLATTVRYAIIILVIVAALGQLGVQTASILAVLGAAGLAIGLALQGTLSNIAAGLMLLWLRPFRVGEYVETPTVAGRVREIGLFATRLDTFDGLYRFVPNSEIWNKPLVNHSRNPVRMANLAIGIPLDADVDKACGIAADVLAADKRILPQPRPEVFVDTATKDGLFIGVRAWLPTDDYWPIHRALAASIQVKLAATGIVVQGLSHPAADVGDAFDRHEPAPGHARGEERPAHAAGRAWGARNG